MATIELEIDDKKHGAFKVYEDGSEIGEMVIGVKDPVLTVYHTEVNKSAEGKGYAKQLLDTMVAYTRENGLEVKPLCPYVHAQFKKHPDVYNDIWLKQ
ncbi:GNAT family N-acetyltransferase [Flavobacterium rhizosphaerae]|uniref:GNAT family N-acetyltransferase n=1 Tax=Flavobacterium rhizosphaerae TaxID=3163298 RepID=A0ABW8YSC1_9FLAO